MKVKRWILVAFKHPDVENSVYYRKNIFHLDRAVKRAEELGANLMSIRGFEIEVEKVPKVAMSDFIDEEQEMLGNGSTVVEGGF